MKVSVGDLVRIKKDLKINGPYHNSDGTTEYFILPMCCYMGELATIEKRVTYGYYLAFSNPSLANRTHRFVWAEGMFDVINGWE